MKVITTRRSKGWLQAIGRRGTRRQRAKYRNAYVILGGGGCYGIGRRYDSGTVADRRRYERAERRRGYAVPASSPYLDGGAGEPMWHGVKGMVGPFWTYSGGIWYGRV